jgi:hypothetical protein
MVSRKQMSVPMSNTDKMITLRLSENDVGQIIDALCVRQDDWRYTQRHFEEVYEESGRISEECRDAEEARRIADYYEEIIAKIRRQLTRRRETSS